jgi:hypothetical protein
LKNAEHEYYCKYEQGSIKISREKKRKLREIDDSIRMTESNLGRKLNVNEHSQIISKWLKKHEYVDLLKARNVGSISHTSNDGNDEIDALDSAVTPIYNANITDDPLDEYIKKTDMAIIREAVKFVLAKKQARSRDCYRALFTLHCIENFRDFEELYPILDKNVLETCQKTVKNQINTKYTKNTTPKLNNVVQKLWHQKILPNSLMILKPT